MFLSRSDLKRLQGLTQVNRLPPNDTVPGTLNRINYLPNNKIVDWSNLKAFADDKICVTEKLKFVLGRVENIMEKGENAGSHNPFSHNVFKGSLFRAFIQSLDCVVKS